MSTPYWQKLRDPRWQRKRLEIMERDHFLCQNCGDETATLNVHHKYYLRGTAPWDYADAALITLCEPCHESAQAKTDRLNVALSQLHNLHGDTDFLIGWCLGKLLIRTAYGREEFVPCAVKLESYEEGAGFSMATETRTQWTADGKDPIAEYLSRVSGVAKASDPMIEPILAAARYS